MEIFYVLTKYVQSRLLHNCRMRERVKRWKVITRNCHLFKLGMATNTKINIQIFDHKVFEYSIYMCMFCQQRVYKFVICCKVILLLSYFVPLSVLAFTFLFNRWIGMKRIFVKNTSVKCSDYNLFITCLMFFLRNI